MFNRSKKKNARSEYRVQVRQGLYVVLRTKGGPVEAVISDISAHGCGVVGPAASLKELSEGSDVPLRIVLGEGEGRPLFLRGTVRRVDSEGRGKTRLGISFEDVERLFPQLEKDQWRYFNRRSAFRVGVTDPGSPDVDIRFTGKKLRGTLSLPAIDISERGLGVRAPVGELEIGAEDALRARFELPGRPGTLDIGLNVAHVTEVPGGIERVGLVVDEETTLRASAVYESISDWAVARQREILERS
ncbi:MAG: PilZ domain-containing protein [Planctomycetota bacterium]